MEDVMKFLKKVIKGLVVVVKTVIKNLKENTLLTIFAIIGVAAICGYVVVVITSAVAALAGYVTSVLVIATLLFLAEMAMG